MVDSSTTEGQVSLQQVASVHVMVANSDLPPMEKSIHWLVSWRDELQLEIDECFPIVSVPRSRFLFLLHWLGKITLETYIMQLHVWLARYVYSQNPLLERQL